MKPLALHVYLSPGNLSLSFGVQPYFLGARGPTSALGLDRLPSKLCDLKPVV